MESACALAKPKSIWRREKTISEMGRSRNIAQPILEVNVVVAAVDAAVVLNGHPFAAELVGDVPLRPACPSIGRTAVSNRSTSTRPRSLRYHSSKTLQRKSP